MLDYATPFGRAGGAGGSMLGGLGRLLEPLDYPRQSAWNLPGKLAQGDFLAALPGLLGAGVGGGLALSGVGLPFATLGGSLAAGLAQGIGRGADDERFAAPASSALVEALGLDPESLGGQATGFGLGVLGDPLTYAGGLGGRAAGRAAGRHLEQVGLSRGPRYSGGPEKLTFGAEHFPPGFDTSNIPDFNARLAELLNSPEAARVLAEVPPGSMPLGIGAEAMALETPQGGVLRLGGGPGTIDVRRNMQRSGEMAPAPTVQTPEMLQPVRELPVGPYRVSHNPFVQMINDEPGLDILAHELRLAQPELAASLQSRGLGSQDLHLGNMGRTAQGRYVITDPGSVAMPGGAIPPEPLPQVQGGPASNFLLDLLGSDRQIQQGLERGMAAYGGEQGLALPQVRGQVQKMLQEAPLQLQKARADRDAAWAALVDARAANAPLDVLEQLAMDLERAEREVGKGKDVLGLPLGRIGTPMAPFEESARKIPWPQNNPVPFVDEADVALRRRANAAHATIRPGNVGGPVP